MSMDEHLRISCCLCSCFPFFHTFPIHFSTCKPRNSAISWEMRKEGGKPSTWRCLWWSLLGMNRTLSLLMMLQHNYLFKQSLVGKEISFLISFLWLRNAVTGSLAAKFSNRQELFYQPPHFLSHFSLMSIFLLWQHWDAKSKMEVFPQLQIQQRAPFRASLQNEQAHRLVYLWRSAPRWQATWLRINCLISWHLNFHHFGWVKISLTLK